MSTAPTPASTPASGGLTDNIAGMLAYVTLIPPIIFLVMEPYNKNKFVRFHSFQSLFFHLAWIVIWVGLTIIGMIPIIGWLTIVLWPLIGLAGFILWIVLLIKANKLEKWKLPVIGDLAEKQADA